MEKYFRLPRLHLFAIVQSLPAKYLICRGTALLGLLEYPCNAEFTVKIMKAATQHVYFNKTFFFLGVDNSVCT